MRAEYSAVPACPEQQSINTPAGKLSFRVAGNGPNIVFLHGILGNSKAWAFQFAALSKHYRVISWDAPGYGASSPLAADIDIYVQQLDQLVSQVATGPINLVGHSMGGTIASRYAVQYAQKVKNLVLSCTHPGYGAPASAPISEKLEKRLQELAQIGREAYGKNRARDLLPFPDVPQFVLDYAAQIASDTEIVGLRQATRMLQLADNRALLPQLSMPILLLTGEQDRVVQPGLTAELLALVPYRQHIEMPGLGHAPYFQAPDYYNGLLDDFFNQQPN